eukprot:scaffold50099_cov32-Tisochrysis_lutea.AAC.4
MCPTGHLIPVQRSDCTDPAIPSTLHHWCRHECIRRKGWDPRRRYESRDVRDIDDAQARCVCELTSCGPITSLPVPA